MKAKTTKYPKTAEVLLEQFKSQMFFRLKHRARKHPEDNFLSMGVADLEAYDLQDFMRQFSQKIEDLYLARGFQDKKVIMKELVNIANMALIEWSIRRMQDEQPRQIR